MLAQAALPKICIGLFFYPLVCFYVISSKTAITFFNFVFAKGQFRCITLIGVTDPDSLNSRATDYLKLWCQMPHHRDEKRTWRGHSCQAWLRAKTRTYVFSSPVPLWLSPLSSVLVLSSSIMMGWDGVSVASCSVFLWLYSRTPWGSLKHLWGPSSL